MIGNASVGARRPALGRQTASHNKWCSAQSALLFPGHAARIRRVAPVAVALALSACAVGPAYVRPAPPPVTAYTANPAPRTIPGAPSASGGAAVEQTLDYGAPVTNTWYEAFGSKALNRLVATALAHNPDLAAAQATLQQAQYNLRAIEGVFYPQIAATGSAARERTSGAAGRPAQLYNLYTGQVAITYSPDVFALNRVAVQGGQAQIDVARDQLRAARLTIAGNVVNTAIALAGVEAQIAATRTGVKALETLVDLTAKRVALGAESRLALLTQQGQLATTQARLPVLEQTRDQMRHVLATYLGRFPAQADAMVVPALADLTLPKTVPVSLPSTLVRARPDIRAAEAQLRAANAVVGERVAALYPSLQLSGNLGGQSNRLRDLFDPAYRIWSVAANLAAPIFAGGTLEAQKHAAESAYQAVFATYRQTVLGAFRNVADALRALEHDAALLDAQSRASSAAEQAFKLATLEYRAGAIDYLALLTSEVQFENARIAQVQARAQRYADTAALYVALGGGEWQERRTTPVTNANGGNP